MKIYFVRHGLAGDRDAFAKSGKSDELRPLTTKGEKKFKEVARSLGRLGLNLDQIYTSPLVRAEQTARILHKQFPKADLKKTAALKPSAGTDKFSNLFKRAKGENLAVVGHEPHLSTTLSWLLTNSENPVVAFKKGGVACVEIGEKIEPGNARLKWLLTPKQTAQLD